MASIINNRKRTRSESENDFEIQTKHFISERAVNLNDINKMKEIHGNYKYR